MQTSEGSPFSRAKNHVVYVRYGEHTGSQANQEMQSFLAAAAITTPTVAACGATTVWANGPMAPPFLDRNDNLASMNTGTLLDRERTV